MMAILRFFTSNYRAYVQILFMLEFSTDVLGVFSTRCVSNLTHNEYRTMNFTPDFLFAASTSAYQVEGGWNLDGKGENIWDRFTHMNPDKIQDRDNADISCDSYHKYEEDVKILSNIGFNIYRFSISWSRILPTGEVTNINTAGIQYYNNLINKVLENGITPMVTIYHWDLPQKLQDMGGWTNALIVDYMEEYADLLFKIFGDRVKWWITLNEPNMVFDGYQRDIRAPGLDLDSPSDYIVIHNLLRAHGRVYKLYEEEYRTRQKGKITISLYYNWMAPKTNSFEDQAAANRAFQFRFNIFGHPIYSTEGDYPALVRNIVDENSKREGRNRSRLPYFTEEEKQAIKGSYDFFALNYYTSKLVTPAKPHQSEKYAFYRDMAVKEETHPSWRGSQSKWLKVVPWGFLELLLMIKNNYNNTPVFITENGYSDEDVIEDCGRINFLREHLNEILKAINYHGCNVIGYTVWSLLDNFEWSSGFKERFGLVRVDFNDPERKRTLRQSALFFKELIKTRMIP